MATILRYTVQVGKTKELCKLQMPIQGLGTTGCQPGRLMGGVLEIWPSAWHTEQPVASLGAELRGGEAP